MSPEHFRRRVRLGVPAPEAYAWHARPGAFERLNPPFAPAEIERSAPCLENGSRLSMRVRLLGPIRARWVAEHRDVIPGLQFRDVQVAGPFASWNHLHRIEPDGDSACVLEDAVEYRHRFGAAGRFLGGRLVERQLARLFDYRHRVTADDLAAHAAATHGAPRATMKILISGSRGLVGSSLAPFLTTGGHTVTRLVRGTAGPGEIAWDPAKGVADPARLEGFDAVVHLAGESIASRWSEAKKARIRESRVAGTRSLAEALVRCANPPKTLVCASAIGYYGDRGSETLTETSAPGKDFLAEVCREWEAAAEPARKKGIRVVSLRFGVILSPAGGALARMLTPFKMGAGGKLGSGAQYMSWLTIDDAVGMIHHAIATPSLAGPVNAVAPNPVTNSEFTKTLGRVLGRPTIFPMPAFAARLLFGEMADALLLSSARVEPAALAKSGYRFRHAELEGALRHVLGRTR